MQNARSNPDWIRDLLGSGPAQSAALCDLREFLLGGLCRAFPKIDRETLEDTVQISLVKVLHSLGSFNDASRFTTWAMSIAVRTVLRDLRAKRWSNVSLDQIALETGGHWAPTDTHSADPAGQSVQNNLVSLLHDLIEERLTPKQRIAILAEVGGMPLEEIARKLQSNLNAVYKLLHDARKRLKAALEEKDITQQDIGDIFRPQSETTSP